MKSVLAAALALAAGTLAVSSPAKAQHLASNEFAVDGAIGLAIPLGDFGTGLNTGYDLMGAVEYHPRQTGQFYFRGELGYSHFGVSNGVNAHASVTRFDVDGLYDFPVGNTVLQPYALAGLGLYHVSVTADNCGGLINCSASSTGLGINFGGGVRYPIGVVQLYVEGRYHLAFTSPGSGNTAFIPLQAGVRYVVK